MKHKGGFTFNLEFLLDLLLGIILGLVILYFIVIIYGFFYSGKEKEMAGQTLASIEQEINKLEIDGNPGKLLLEVPRGWYLVSFEKGGNSNKKEILPQTSCADESCLCICKPEKIIGLIDKSADCRKNAECRVFKPFKENGKDLYIKIPQKNPIEITRHKTGDYEFFDVLKK